MYNTLEICRKNGAQQFIGSDEAIQVAIGEEMPVAFIGNAYLCPGYVKVHAALTFEEANYYWGKQRGGSSI